VDAWALGCLIWGLTGVDRLVYVFGMGNETKENLLAAGCAVFKMKGYHGAGLSDILKQAGVPKGSFYHYFENKEHFLAEVLYDYARCMGEQIAPFLRGQNKPALERFQEFMQSMVVCQEKEGCCGGCLIGNMAQEMCDDSEVIRRAVKHNFSAWVLAVKQFFEQGREDGSIDVHHDSALLADMFADGWQGAMLRMKIEKNIEPLSRFLNNFIHILRA
jgi:TetR/AcrR family transcriptional repressor of nem operon